MQDEFSRRYAENVKVLYGTEMPNPCEEVDGDEGACDLLRVLRGISSTMDVPGSAPIKFATEVMLGLEEGSNAGSFHSWLEEEYNTTVNVHGGITLFAFKKRIYCNCNHLFS